MAPAFNELVPFLVYCKTQSNIEPIVYFNHDSSHAVHQVKYCLDQGVIAYDQNGLEIKEISTSEGLRSQKQDSRNEGYIKLWMQKLIKNIVLKNILKKIIKTLNSRLYNPLIEVNYLISRFKAIKLVIEQQQPVALLMAVDMIDVDSALIIKYAKFNKLPIYGLTWLFASGDDPANVYSNSNTYPDHQPSRFLNRLLIYLFPKYKYIYKNKAVVRLPAMQAFVRETLRLSCNQPWVFNSGNLDHVVVDSVFMMKYYTAAGLDEKKMIVLGTPSQDILARVLQNRDEHKAKIFDRYLLDHNKPLVLVGIPPDCYGMLDSSSKLEFSNYSCFLKFYVSTVNTLRDTYNLIFTVHPGTTIDQRAVLEQQYEINVIKTDDITVDILPLATLFITSVSSSIRWALACQIPTVDYDFYNFGNQLGEQPAVYVSHSKDEFSSVVAQLRNDSSYLTELTHNAIRSSRNFGTLDGNACKRLLTSLLSAGTSGQ